MPMKTYIINMPSDTERRRRMETNVASSPLGADMEFVPGVSTRAMTPAQLAAAFDYRRYGRLHHGMPSLGEAGCSLAHYSLWQRIAASDTPAWILEDDIYFDGPWGDIPEYTLRYLTSDEPRVLLLPRHYFYRTSRREGSLTAADSPKACYGTECYAINPAGARLLMSLGRPHYIADEWDYYRSRGLQTQALFPHPVVHDYSLASNIGHHFSHRYDYDGAARTALPGVFLYDFRRMLCRIILHKLGFYRLYLSDSER